MRIGIFSDTYPPEINGVATVSALLEKVFTAHGHEVVVVTTGPKQMKKSYTVEGNVVRINSRNFKHLYNYRAARIYNFQAARYIKSLDLEVIHVQTEVGIGLFGRFISKMNHIPLVYTYHTLYEDYTYYVTKGKKLFDRFAKHVVADVSRILADTSTEFTTTSSKTRDALRRYGVNNYINIVPNGIDLEIFRDEEFHMERIKTFKKEHGLENKFVILVLGRLAKEKSNDVIIDYYADYVKKYGREKTHLLIVGGGPDEDLLKEQASKLGLDGVVTFLGPVKHEEVPFYYHLADLFVSASISETQGLTFIESMASHTLVLARYDECLDGVIEDGKSGYFYHDSESFMKKLDELVTLDAKILKRIKDNSYEIVLSKYSLEAYYEAMYTVYRRAVRKYW